MKYYAKTANENAITPCLPPCSSNNCNAQMIGQFFAFIIPHLPSVIMLILSPNTLSKFLSSPLLDFVPRDNNEQSDELDMLLEILSDSNVQSLDSKVRATNTSKTIILQMTVFPLLLISLVIAHALEIRLTTPLQRALLLQLLKMI